MKILSVYYKNNEISLHNNLIGKKSVYYNGNLMESKWSLFGTKISFNVIEGNEEITYTAGFSYNNHGQYQGDVWRNYEPLVISSHSVVHRPRRPLEHSHSDYV